MKIGVIIQARFSSTRFPGKVLKELPYASGITVLSQVIRRLRRSERINSIAVATTIKKDDEGIATVARQEKAECFRGSEKDVLSRYYLSAKKDRLDIVVRVSSDCPCIDPGIADAVIDKHIRTRADYTSNTLKRTYPHGLDVEVFNFAVLEKAYKNGKRDYEREHVTPYIYLNPARFKIVQKEAPKALHAPDIRITLDTEEDYAVLCCTFDQLYRKNRYFTTYDIVRLFVKKPWVKLINRKIIQKKVSNNRRKEFEEARKLLELQGLDRASEFFKKSLIYEHIHSDRRR